MSNRLLLITLLFFSKKSLFYSLLPYPTSSYYS